MCLFLSSLVFFSLIYFSVFVQIPPWESQTIFQSLSTSVCWVGPAWVWHEGAILEWGEGHRAPGGSLLPTITCYWALLPSSATPVQTDLKTSFHQRHQFKKKILTWIWRLWHVPGSVIQRSFCNLSTFHHFKRILGNFSPEWGITLTGSVSHFSEIWRGFHELQPICSWAFWKLKVF